MLSNHELSVRFFLQLAVILAACRGIGWLARRIGQPQVVGEMIAGVLLGPSLLGWLFPEAQAWLFPKQSLTILYAISQVGISLYMFLVGIEFRQELLRERARSAASVSFAGMLVPFVLGAVLGYWLVGEPGFFGERVHATDAALFLGAAMAITAFPMLARIIYERGLTGTSLGVLALAAGAIDDATAWCVLAIVLANLDHNWSVAAKAIGGGVAYAVVMLTVGRRWLTHLGQQVERQGKLTHSLLGITLMLALLGAWFTEAIRIYAVFGAFVLGVAMPRGRLAQELRQALEPLVVVLLLPLFFTCSGLQTRLDMVTTPGLWGIALLVLAAACLGKGGACYAAARWHGEDHRTAMAVGCLMNARGLMELIILNIGLQYNVIQPTLFAIMVLMAILTTLMATPLFERSYGRDARASGQLGQTALD